MKASIQSIQVLLGNFVQEFSDLKRAFIYFKNNKIECSYLHIYYDDGKHLQFFYNSKGNYIEVETLNWK